MYWYILYVKTGREHKVELFIKSQLGINDLIPFIPMLETLYRMKGQVKKELKPLFPGYVFIETEIPDLAFLL